MDPEKTTDLGQVTDNLYHIMLYTSPWSRFELTALVVIGTDSIDSCKFNYHTITTASALTWCIIYIQIITKQTYINLALVTLSHFGYIRFYSKILKWSGIIIFLCQYNLFTPWYSWNTDNLGVKYQSITCTGSHSWLFCLDLLLCVLSKTFKLLCFPIFWL